MAQLDSVNRLSCPEIAGHTTQNGIVAYAVRMPGETEWQGVSSIGGPTIKTFETYCDPRDAVAAIREAFARARLDW